MAPELPPGSLSSTTLPLAQWNPAPTLVTRKTDVVRPIIRAIDIHNHLGRWLSQTPEWMCGDVGALVALLDEAGVDAVVNLDGRWSDDLHDNLARYDMAYPTRFLTFCHLDWSVLSESGSPDDKAATTDLTQQLERAAEAGARGVKIWKDLGLSVRDATGQLVMPDDARVVAAARAAGELGLPILIHTADPIAFFDPLDDHNERIDELTAMPEWWFGGPDHPTFDALFGALRHLVESCPNTTFVGAHVGCLAEDLGRVGAMLADCPNWHVDTGGRMAELGRQPHAFARLVEEFPSRVVFGSDCFPPDLAEYRRWWRFFETDDEHFTYHDEGEQPPQGRWRISGAHLPHSLLSAVYRDNAQRILGL